MNNTSKQQFKKRDANFSTHGSRRGYSELGSPLSEVNFLPLGEARAALVHNKSIALEAYRNERSKENLSNLNNIDSKLAKVNAEIKEHNQKVSNRQDLNKGLAFMNVANRLLDKEVFSEILHIALSEYDLYDGNNQHINSISNALPTTK